jgi:hypothetical protein
MRANCSYGDLDNMAYFYFYFWTPLAFLPDFASLAKSTKSKLFFKFMSRPCALTHRVYALTHRLYLLMHSRWKVASADPVR